MAWIEGQRQESVSDHGRREQLFVLAKFRVLFLF